MLHKLLLFALSALLLLSGTALASVEIKTAEHIAPEEPIVTHAQRFTVTAVYDEAADCTRYAIAIAPDACFADGTPFTAQDLLFTWYVYLDPAFEGELPLTGLSIDGLRSYRLQLTDAQLDEGLRIMDGIRQAGADHVWTEADAWTKEAQDAYWALVRARDDAAAAEFPVLAGQIVGFCTSLLDAGSGSLPGFSASEILADEGLAVANAMVQWGYARLDDGVLTAPRTGKVWRLNSGEAPSADDFAAELKSAYKGDFHACWSTECPDMSAYSPLLPSVEDPFLLALYPNGAVSVPSVSGIVCVDDRTVEVTLSGIDMRSDSLLLGIHMLSLASDGDSALWNPAQGVYGHAFGVLSAVDLDGELLYEHTSMIEIPDDLT